VDYGGDSSGRKDSHEALQLAIDTLAARPAGGIVYIPAGRYRIAKTVFIRNNVHLYSSPGAVLEVPAGIDEHSSQIVYRGVIPTAGTREGSKICPRAFDSRRFCWKSRQKGINCTNASR